MSFHYETIVIAGPRPMRIFTSQGCHTNGTCCIKVRPTLAVNTHCEGTRPVSKLHIQQQQNKTMIMKPHGLQTIGTMRHVLGGLVRISPGHPSPMPSPSPSPSPSPLRSRYCVYVFLISFPPYERVQPGNLSCRDSFPSIHQLRPEHCNIQVQWQLQSDELAGYPQYLFVIIIQNSSCSWLLL
jgi:hypothetical protein